MEKKATTKHLPAGQTPEPVNPQPQENLTPDDSEFDKWIDKYELLKEFPMSDKTLSTNCKQGYIPHSYIGKHRIFNRTELERKLRRNQKGGLSETGPDSRD